MHPDFYMTLHYVGLVVLFISLGGLGALAMTGQYQSKAKSGFVAFHGIGLILLLLGGFGWLGATKMGFPIWAILKLVIWLAFGALIVPLKRVPAAAKKLTLIGVPVLALCAIVLGVWHVALFGS